MDQHLSSSLPSSSSTKPTGLSIVSMPEKFHPPKSFLLPKRAFGSKGQMQWRSKGGARGAVAPGAELRGALKSWGKIFFYRSNKNFKSRSKVRLSIISLIIVRYRLSLKEKLYSDHRTTIVWIGVSWPEIVRRGR